MSMSKRTQKNPTRQHRPWSASRPDKSKLEDNLAGQLFTELRKDQRSQWAMADKSGLSPGTIARYAHGDVRRPQSLSLQMLARSLGFKIVLQRR